MQQKSVLTIYRFETADAGKFSFADAERFLDDNYGTKAFCMEVIGFELDPAKLAISVDAIVAGDPKLKAGIEELRQNGANFMFAGPVVGKALWGRALL